MISSFIIAILPALVNFTSLTIGSPAFTEKGLIPSKYTCEGDNVNPAITIGLIPSGTKSLALIVEDPDATNGTFDHWVIWNIRPISMIDENSAPGIEGKNGSGEAKYKGPCPPTGIHRYFFKVFALDILLDLKQGASKTDVQRAMENHILASGELVGTYKKNK